MRKGTLYFPNWVLYGVIGLVVLYGLGFFNNVNVGSFIKEQSVAPKSYDISLSLSGLPSGVTVDDTDDKNIVVTVDSSDIASSLNMSGTMTIIRTDTIADENNAYPVFKVKLITGNEGAHSFKGYSTTTETYYTIDYDESTGYYNTSIDGLSVASSNKYGANVQLQQGVGQEVSFWAILQNATSVYDAEMIQDQYASEPILGYEVVGPDGTSVAKVTFKYVKTA